MESVIFDLDQTLIDSSKAQQSRDKRQWSRVYDMIPNFILYEGIHKSLEILCNRQIKICILTSAPEVYCSKVLAFWKIPYTCTVCYHDTNHHKPHPEPFLLALKKLGQNASDTISFGDRDIDITGSKNAGIRSVACSWGVTDVTELLQVAPDVLIDHPQEIPKTVAEHLSNTQRQRLEDSRPDA